MSALQPTRRSARSPTTLSPERRRRQLNMATTRLHLAAGKGDKTGAQACLQAGDPIDQPDQHGNSALHIAAKGGFGELIQMLAGARANVNLQATTTGATPLVFASMGGHSATVQQLLGLGAQPGLATRKGKTALTVAQEKGHQQVVALLSQAPAPAPAAAAAFGSPSPLGGGAAFGAPAGGAFGAPAGGAFGAPAPAAFGGPAPAAGAFGAPAPAAGAFGAPAPASGAFGAPAPAAANPFGAAAPSAAAAKAAAFGAGFGSSPAPGAAASPSPFGGLFGAGQP